MKKIVKLALKIFPNLCYFILYIKAAKTLGDNSKVRKRILTSFEEETENKKCLQIGYRYQKYQPHWICVDLFDTTEQVDYNYDIKDLKFKDETFDIVVCNAIIEHVERPEKAISELRRVLKTGGKIYIEMPFNQPYHPSPQDYWRVTPEGLRLWMKDFVERSSGFFRIHRSVIYNGLFFYGEK